MTQTAETTADYQKTIRVKARPAALFEALTTAFGLSAWWAPATGSGLPGGDVTFTMNSPEPLVVHVDEATPKSVQWTVTSCDFMSDWVGTRPSFTITPVGEESELRFRHIGLTPDLDCIEMCTSGWNHFIPSLGQYAETGSGNPNGSEADQARRVRDNDR